MGVTQVEGWTESNLRILNPDQRIFLNGSSSLAEIINNRRRNVLVVAAHQDDEAIGMGGTMKLYSTGVRYNGPEDIRNLHEVDPNSFFRGGLGIYPRDEIIRLKEELKERGIHLDLVPEEPTNVVVVYVTSGAKTTEGISKDLGDAHPSKPLEQILFEHKVRFDQEISDMQELTGLLNSLRYPEALRALKILGAEVAIFLEYQSSQLRLDTEKVARDLAGIIGIVKPDIIYTHSPFELSHKSHIHTSKLTVDAARQIQSPSYMPDMKGYVVWNPFVIFHPHVVDISTVFDSKLDAVQTYSGLGSQFSFGRRYESVLSVNKALAAALFNASMRRPRLPSGILAAEPFVDLNPLVRSPNISLKEFVEGYFQRALQNYPA